MVIDGTSNLVMNCTIAENDNHQVLLAGGNLDLYFSIIAAHQPTQYCLYHEEGEYKGNYNNWWTTNGAFTAYYDSAIRARLSDWKAASGGWDWLSLAHNPLFVNATNGDFHLRSSMPSGTYVLALGSWTNFAGEDSPSIDACNPLVSYTNEPTPNGSAA